MSWSADVATPNLAERTSPPILRVAELFHREGVIAIAGVEKCARSP